MPLRANKDISEADNVSLLCSSVRVRPSVPPVRISALTVWLLLAIGV